MKANTVRYVAYHVTAKATCLHKHLKFTKAAECTRILVSLTRNRGIAGLPASTETFWTVRKLVNGDLLPMSLDEMRALYELENRPVDWKEQNEKRNKMLQQVQETVQQ
jgi:hypothetical protein